MTYLLIYYEDFFTRSMEELDKRETADMFIFNQGLRDYRLYKLVENGKP